MKKINHEDFDPTVKAFLDFLEADIKEHPERLRVFDKELMDRIAVLVEGVEVDLDAELPDDGEPLI